MGLHAESSSPPAVQRRQHRKLPAWLVAGAAVALRAHPCWTGGSLSRRDAAVAGSLITAPQGASAFDFELPKPPPPRPRTYTEVVQEAGLEDWQLPDYEAMRDDVPRTSKFASAIKRRCAQEPGATVVDIGTGPFALLALIAARAGAKKVYAIEKNEEAAKYAKKFVAKEGMEDKVIVISGDSMQIDLPEKCDFIVSELIGSIATQEGVTPIIADARQRFLKPEVVTTGMIPERCQTLIAPIKYKGRSAMDRLTKPVQGLRSRGRPSPGSAITLRVPAESPGWFDVLSEPQLLEDFDYNRATPDDLKTVQERELVFDVPEREGTQFSGFAMWTRVVVDSEDVIDVRKQPDSHWAYVIVRMLQQPVSLALPSAVSLKASTDYTLSPVRYSLEATVQV
mmetsp:Transcript_27186/g.63271  ORF Transcript_27186/g.63271 Transcript_27186/m.63271 type:complete len:396 (+) Transcript_27186:95-1282(+)|eukprot:CAMPEP_0178407622 /NCGR_PEP_ID=MMETSP0689_2-20121128/19522_1 /TAXON_ID=160604 /ORGANISM="Amphidinium massartii, Strain CS-259" /LENGTH=395 /DNA_ID=CAMNT_0020028699 /DNA_START=16 /DNA_END=1203 /DNA_ORIENTATION=+